MRIAIFTNTYWPTVNGVAISVANLKRGLEAAGHEVWVFAPSPPGFDRAQDEPGVVRFPAVAAPVEADYPLAVPCSRAVVRTLRQLNFDLVHTEHPMWVGSWGAWYARCTRRPLVTTIHTQYETYSRLIPLPNALVDAYLRAQVRAYCNSCDWVTTPAASARDRLLARGVKAPIEVVYNPTDLSECFRADGRALRRELGTSDGELLLGYVGRLAPEKGLPDLIKAAGLVLQRLPQARLIVIGDGPSRPKIEAMARALPNGDRVRFLGRVPHDRVPEHQAALDLFITGSQMEVQPLSFAEAFATGTPIVAYDVPGNNDMIEDGVTGRLVPPQEGANGLAAAAIELLTSPDTLARLSANARTCSQRFDQPQVVQRMLEVYQWAIERANGRRRRSGPG
ncbi:MAG: glycosyltransferase [Armatimonadetes bacterium]|nr:glycosyltransferase [Armatimonadota bacterium]